MTKRYGKMKATLDWIESMLDDRRATRIQICTFNDKQVEKLKEMIDEQGLEIVSCKEYEFHSADSKKPYNEIFPSTTTLMIEVRKKYEEQATNKSRNNENEKDPETSTKNS